MPSTHISRTAALLINLGTPDAPTPRAVYRYLTQFLSDSRVIELPKLWWWPILHTAILPFRARLSAAKYARIWLAQGSPLHVYTQQQTQALRGHYATNGDQITIDYAMRYGTPSIATVLTQLSKAGIERILLVPMYPQYAAATTASAFDAAFLALRQMRNQPEVRTIKHYADFPPYIAALAAHVREYWTVYGWPDFAGGARLLLSFHGLPKRMVERGDPYYAQCQLTGKLLAQALGLSETAYQITFQSRFGLIRWLQPYTAATLKAFGAAGVKRVDVFCPGFTADCLETIEEIGIEGRAIFLRAGGEEYHRIPCINAAKLFIDCLAEVIRLHSQG